MGVFAFFGSLFIAGIVAALTERHGLTRNGLIPSLVIALGGVMLVFMIRVMFGIGFASPGLNAIAGALGALLLIVPAPPRGR